MEAAVLNQQIIQVKHRQQKKNRNPSAETVKWSDEQCVTVQRKDHVHIQHPHVSVLYFYKSTESTSHLDVDKGAQIKRWAIVLCVIAPDPAMEEVSNNKVLCCFK